MKLKELIAYLEEVAPLRYQESYDNAGLIVGDPEVELSAALISLDATPEVILEAVSRGCNVVVSHHPIVFKGIKQFDHNYYVHQAVITAIKHDIALYAIHTNLDNVLQNGVNERIAQQLGLLQVQVLKPHAQAHLETKYELGSGAVGIISPGLSESVFIDHVKQAMNQSHIRHTALLGRKIQKVAVCGGAGSFLIPAAISAGAQAYITADIKYHEFFEANKEIVVLDIGHYESEYYTIELLQGLISQKFHNFAAHCTEAITNPVFYS